MTTTANAPTEKQIRYLLSLCGVQHESQAFAKDMGCSTSAAERRATRQDVSRTIDRLKKEQ